MELNGDHLRVELLIKQLLSVVSIMIPLKEYKLLLVISYYLIGSVALICTESL